MAVREMIKIDEELCDGCGLCVPSCAEGAIQIIDGKAKLVGDVLCDGLGACLGDCPTGALTIETREADDYDETAVEKHLETVRPESVKPATAAPQHQGCPSTRPMTLQPTTTPASASATEPPPSALGHWPVKLGLVPPHAPFLQGADLMMIADCVPIAFADAHNELIRGNAVVIGCPKFDDFNAGVERLAAILRDGGVRSITVAHMEVPCCFGYWKMAEDAVAASGRDLEIGQVIIGANGTLRRPGPDDVVMPHLSVQRPIL